MKLISMVDFVLSLDTTEHWDSDFTKSVNYANFLNKPLEKWMFVPSTEDGEVLEKPKGTNLNSSFFEMQVDYNSEVKWELAKERCLFEGFEVIEKAISGHIYKKITSQNLTVAFYNKVSFWSLEFDTIEDLVKYNLTLTATALKEIQG